MRLALLLLPAALLLAQDRNVPIDNEYVRVLSVVDQPLKQPGALHEHKLNRVMIYLDPGEIQLRYKDGQEENQHWNAGDVAWSPASGLHTSRNASPKPVRIVEIELKVKKGKPKIMGREAPGRNLVDNPQVRVYRAAKGPVTAARYVAVDIRKGAVLWNQLPASPGPFVIAEIK